VTARTHRVGDRCSVGRQIALAAAAAERAAQNIAALAADEDTNQDGKAWTLTLTTRGLSLTEQAESVNSHADAAARGGQGATRHDARRQLVQPDGRVAGLYFLNVDQTGVARDRI
jgi:hypothetical protein